MRPLELLYALWFILGVVALLLGVDSVIRGRGYPLPGHRGKVIAWLLAASVLGAVLTDILSDAGERIFGWPAGMMTAFVMSAAVFVIAPPLGWWMRRSSKRAAPPNKGIEQNARR